MWPSVHAYIVHCKFGQDWTSGFRGTINVTKLVFHYQFVPVLVEGIYIYIYAETRITDEVLLEY